MWCQQVIRIGGLEEIRKLVEHELLESEVTGGALLMTKLREWPTDQVAQVGRAQDQEGKDVQELGGQGTGRIIYVDMKITRN